MLGPASTITVAMPCRLSSPATLAPPAPDPTTTTCVSKSAGTPTLRALSNTEKLRLNAVIFTQVLGFSFKYDCAFVHYVKVVGELESERDVLLYQKDRLLFSLKLLDCGGHLIDN